LAIENELQTCQIVKPAHLVKGHVPLPSLSAKPESNLRVALEVRARRDEVATGLIVASGRRVPTRRT
jgi:hypothetical protein